MPEKILELLELGSLTQWQIAETLQLSFEEVNACIDYLQQAGFIKATIINPSGGGGCSGNCGKCSSSCNAGSPSSYRAWEII